MWVLSMLLQLALYSPDFHEVKAREDLSPLDLASICSVPEVCLLLVGDGVLLFLDGETWGDGIYSHALEVGEKLKVEVYWVFKKDTINQKLTDIANQITQQFPGAI